MLRLATFDADLAARLDALRADLSAVDASRRLVEASLADGEAHYGVNTGFGALKNVRIDTADVAQLQVNLLRSHAVGVGTPIPPDLTRTMLRLKIHALGLGYSGAEVLDRVAGELAATLPRKVA